MWFPPETWEAHGVPYDAYTRRYEIADAILCERFCPTCACAQKTTGEVPCWNCGGETTPTRPAFWPVAGANQIVIRGDSWSPGEEEDERNRV